MFNSGLPQINVSPRSPFSSGSPNRASNRPSRPRLNPYRTPDRPTLPTSYSSTSSINTTSTTDSTFSIRSFSSDSSPVTPPSDVEQSTNLWSNIRPRNLSVSPTRAPRKPRYRPQKIAPQSRSDGDQGQVEVQDNDEYVNHDDCQDEVELKVPGAFLDYAEEPVVHRNRSLEIDNNSNSTSVQYPILPTVEPQYPRFTSYGSSRKSTREINHSIRSLLQKPLKPHCDLTAGYIYAFESPIYAPSHIKIGQSSRAPETRMREWSKCGIPISEITKPASQSSSNGKDAFYHYTLVESILFEEFHNQRKWFECDICKNSQRGPKRHIEWLEIDASTATHAINRWRSWLEREKPFTSLGILTSYWQWRVNELPKNSSNMNWDVWTRPGVWEYCAFRLEQFSFHTSKLIPRCFFVFVSFLLYSPEFTVSFVMVLLAL